MLTENMFQDCRKDVEFLRSRAGKEAIMMLHVEGISDYMDIYMILNTIKLYGILYPD